MPATPFWFKLWIHHDHHLLTLIDFYHGNFYRFLIFSLILFFIYISVLNLSIYLIPRPIPAIINGVMLAVLLHTGPPYQNSNCTGSHETVCVYKEQALTGTRYPTRPGLFFSYPNRTRKIFQNIRVQGSNYIIYMPLLVQDF